MVAGGRSRRAALAVTPRTVRSRVSAVRVFADRVYARRTSFCVTFWKSERVSVDVFGKSPTVTSTVSSLRGTRVERGFRRPGEKIFVFLDRKLTTASVIHVVTLLRSDVTYTDFRRPTCPIENVRVHSFDLKKSGLYKTNNIRSNHNEKFGYRIYVRYSDRTTVSRLVRHCQLHEVGSGSQRHYDS